MMTYNKSGGITLVELLVAMGLGVVLMAGVMQVFLGSSQTFSVVQAQTHMQENGRFAMEFIASSVRHAGYDTDISFNAQTNIELKAERWPAVDGFETNAVVAGTNNNPDIAGAKSSSDTISVRYRGAANAPMRDCAGNDIAEDTMTVTSFFVTETGDFRCQVSGGAVDTTVTLVEGIDELHVAYGVNASTATPSQVGAYMSADDVPDWSRVIAVKLALLASSSEEALDNSAVNYDFSSFGEGDISYQDRKARQKFVQTIGLRNKLL